MTEYLLTPAEINTAYINGLSTDEKGTKQGHSPLQDVRETIAQAQLTKCGIPARQREAVEMVFERVEELRRGCKQKPSACISFKLLEYVRQEILDKIVGSDDRPKDKVS